MTDIKYKRKILQALSDRGFSPSGMSDDVCIVPYEGTSKHGNKTWFHSVVNYTEDSVNAFLKEHMKHYVPFEV